MQIPHNTNHVFIYLALASLLTDMMALWMTLHARKHERENTARLVRIEAALLNSHTPR